MQNDAWALKIEKMIEEKDRFYNKVEKVVIERFKVFLAMVLLVRSENDQNEMTYFGFVSLRRYFKKKLENKIFSFDEEADMDDKWNFFMTELVYKIKRYEEEKEENEDINNKNIVAISFIKILTLNF